MHETTAAMKPPGTRERSRLRQLLLSEYLIVILTMLYFLFVYVFVPSIATPDSLLDILMQMSPLMIAAVGQTFVLIIAGIDLSTSAILAVTSVIGGSILSSDTGIPLPLPLLILVGILAFVLVGGIIGLVNGVAVTGFGMPAFIVTLTTMMFFNGFAIYYTSLVTSGGTSFGDLPDFVVAIGSGHIFGVPCCVIVAGLVMIAGHFVLSRTVFGARLYAIGRNPRAAAISGVPVGRYIVIAFVVSSVCSAIASLLYTGQLETGSPVLGQTILLDVVGAAVIGGVSLFGGRGRISWAFYGVLFLTVVDKGLQLLGIAEASVFAIKGLLILLAAVLDTLRHRLAKRG
jgi:ribose/xylose/arabinose/galactoside ABC-type transport system permease subunit